MMSPARIPAAAAGLPSKTVETNAPSPSDRPSWSAWSAPTGS